MRLDDAMRATLCPDTPTDLYRYYDAHGVLLYVGISKSAVARAMQHEHGALWWGRWAVMMRQPFPTRADALAAERHAIRTERPAFNIVHTEQKAVS